MQYELLKALVAMRGCSPRWATTTRASTAGAAPTIDNLKRLPQDYPRLKVIPLEQNYRSTAPSCARPTRSSRQPEALREEGCGASGEGEPVRVIECDGEEHEAERAVARIQACGGAAVAWFSGLRGAVPRQPPGQACSSRSCARRRSCTRVRAARAVSTAPRSGPVRLAAPAGQPGRRPGLPARRHHAQARHRATRRWQLAGRVRSRALPVRGAVPPAACALRAKGAPSTACTKFGREVNDLRHRARTRGAPTARAADGWKDIGYDSTSTTARTCEAWPRRRWDQRAGLRRLDGQRRCGRSSTPRRATASSATSRACWRWRRPSRHHQPGRARRRRTW